jgi:hypothetical protein
VNVLFKFILLLGYEIARLKNSIIAKSGLATLFDPSRGKMWTDLVKGF